MAGSSRLEYVARVGHGARATVYLLLGGFALLAAIRGGRAPGSRGALSEMLGAPGGRILLAAVGVGLLAFSAWRVLQAIFDPEGHGSDAKGVALRASFVTSAATHILLAVAAFSIGFGWGAPIGGSEEESTRHWTAWLMSKPLGRWVVGLVGCGILGKAAIQFVQAFRGDFENRLAMERDGLRWAVPLTRVGLCARGVVFAIIGSFLVVAALKANPGEARGIEGALATLQEQPYGPWLLGVVGSGLIAFSAYGFVEAVYGRFPVPRKIQKAMDS